MKNWLIGNEVVDRILGSESFARWLISLALVLELELVLVLELELELALALDIECYHITASVSHLTCPLSPHVSQSFDLPAVTTSSVRASTSTRDSASARHRALPYHQISQSFDLPPATTSVGHLTCPLPPHQSFDMPSTTASLQYHINASVNHLNCPHHHINQSFDMPSTTASLHYCITALVSHLTCPNHHISQSFDLPPATTSVSHLTCPLPPHQSVI